MSAALGSLRTHPRHLVLAALAGGLALGWRPAWLIPAVLLAAAGATALGVRQRIALLIAVVLVAGAVLSQVRTASLSRNPLAGDFGHSVAAAVIIEQSPRGGRFGWWAGGKLDGNAVLLRAPGRPPPLDPGEIVQVRGSLRPLGERDNWLRPQHVRAILRVHSLAVTGSRRAGPSGLIDLLRNNANSVFSARLPPDEAALLRGIALGDDSALSDRLRDAMRRSGLGHLVAASGANIALLVVLVFSVCALLGAPRGLRLALALAAVGIYVPLAGSGPSIQRAAIMGAAALVASAASRPSARWYSLLLAATVSLTLNPAILRDPGWQLSFAAVAAIGILSGPLQVALERRGLPAPVSGPLSLTAAATVGTAPISAAAFGTVSLVSLPANLAAAAAVAPATWLGMVAAVLSQVSDSLAAPVCMLAYWPLAAILAVARAASSLPGAQISVSPPIVASVSMAAVAIVLGGRRRRPVLVAAAIALSSVVWVALGVARSASRLAPPPAGAVRVTFLDVGQGDATLVESEGHSALIDSGPPTASLGPLLDRAGIKRLDLLVATHAQADHLGGADRVLESLPVGAVLDGRDGVVEPEGTQMAAAARGRRVPLVTAAAGDSIRVGALLLTILSPQPLAGDLPRGDPNQRAIVILAQARGFSLLLTSDAESDVLLGLEIPTVDLLKVSHHGSADPGLPLLLAKINPRIAAIEVGAGNSYGHPAEPTLAALAAR
ncbi:MAG: MBL fold metallo-hydrolase, partial [Actinobacteria bacterium]|nr:MBL fold metallo-hydrolase [Actinomycetota bacterium]